jgi:hypothetical protein
MARLERRVFNINVNKTREMKKLSTFNGLKKGAKVKVIDNTNSHNYDVGTVYTMQINGSGTHMSRPFAEFREGNNLKASDCVLYSDYSVAGMEKEVEDLKKQIADIQEKINLCKELGLTLYDETYITVHKTLQTLKGKASDAEKTRIIVALLKKMD